MTPGQPYYRPDLALVHDGGFGHHAERCAPGILDLLSEVRARDGLVVELGCGSGLLTRHLLDAGHRVIATDASPAMLDLTRDAVGDRAEVRRLTLPDDPIPAADAIVSVGHCLNYLSDAATLEKALVAVGRALRPGGVLAIDLCDMAWGEHRRDAAPIGLAEDDWAIVIRFSLPAPDRFVRDITTFVRRPDEAWRRDDERHENVLVPVEAVPALLAPAGVEASIRPAFGREPLPPGLFAIVGHARAG
jgi:SAM-dependent methyltransferase